MSRKRFTTEQIITKLREVEVELAKGQKHSAGFERPNDNPCP